MLTVSNRFKGGIWTPIVFSARDICLDKMAEGEYISLLLHFYIWGSGQHLSRLKDNLQSKVLLGPQILMDQLSEEELRKVNASTIIADIRRV